MESKSFYSVLASAILSDNLFTFRPDFITDMPLHLSLGLVLIVLKLFVKEKGGKQMSKLNDDTCRTFAVSTLEPSLHKGCNSPSAERLYSPLFVLNPKGTASRGPLHQGVVRWAESGGWFNESVTSFLGCLILGLPLPPLCCTLLKCLC
jgi:hypothetical protein